MADRCYIAIDLKSFFASVECVDRGLDPLTTNLVVADARRTEKTICLAVSPALKAYGIPGRPRLFEVIQRVEEANVRRKMRAPGGKFSGASKDDTALKDDPSLALDYWVAPPQMARYMEVSTQVYDVYLKYVAMEDIHVYSIDEVFMDVTDYLPACGLSPRDFAMRMIRDVLHTTGITATAGIGTNLYLCKIAMDIDAKRSAPDSDGVRIAELDETSYRQRLWSHRPLTDFWRIGRGYAKKLEENGMYTMGDVARCSIGGKNSFHNEALLYKLFGVNAELLIDHAWGWEPCTMAEIKAYKPETHSVSSGQVLSCPYDFSRGRLIVREMTDLLALDLVDKGLAADQMVLTVGYDVENLTDPARKRCYHGPITSDHYGRSVPKAAHGSISLGRPTSSGRRMTDAMMELYDRIVDERLLVRRMYVVANHVSEETDASQESGAEQLDLFTDYEAAHRARAAEEAELERERRRQRAVLTIQKRYGRNAILRGMNFEAGATTMERNGQIGGHKA